MGGVVVSSSCVGGVTGVSVSGAEELALGVQSSLHPPSLSPPGLVLLPCDDVVEDVPDGLVFPPCDDVVDEVFDEVFEEVSVDEADSLPPTVDGVLLVSVTELLSAGFPVSSTVTSEDVPTVETVSSLLGTLDSASVLTKLVQAAKTATRVIIAVSKSTFFILIPFRKVMC